MEGVVDGTRTGGGRALGENGESEELGDRGSQKTIVPLRLVVESEESEEEVGAEDDTPSIHLARIAENWV